MFIDSEYYCERDTVKSKKKIKTHELNCSLSWLLLINSVLSEESMDDVAANSNLKSKESIKALLFFFSTKILNYLKMIFKAK